MVIMIDITVESTGLSIKFLTFNSLYAIIAFDYYFAAGYDFCASSLAIA
jgi:energy-converting hydrogenase Eha subunit E